MPVKFCHVLCYKCTWYLFNYRNLLVRSVYRFHVYFHVRIILHHLGISLQHQDGLVLARSKILILKVRITVFVMIMALMQMKYGCMGIGFTRQEMVFLVV